MRIKKTVTPILSITLTLVFLGFLAAFTGQSINDEHEGHSHDDLVHEVWEIEDKTWGTFIVNMDEDPGAATNRHIIMTVSVICKDQKNVKRTIFPPQQFELSKVNKLCDVQAPKYDEASKTMTVDFQADSGAAIGKNDICDIPMSQSFEIKKICNRWAPNKTK